MSGLAEWIAFTAGLVITAAALSMLVFVVGRPDPVEPFPRTDGPHRALADWERDRLGGIAKSLAAAAVTFLSSMFLAVLKDEIKTTVEPVWVVGIALGVVGSLVTAMVFHLRADNWARTYFAKSV